MTEVVLAVGVLSIAILALLGMFAPTVSVVKDVTAVDEASRVLSQLRVVNTFAPNNPVEDKAREGMTYREVVQAVTSNAQDDKVYYSWVRVPIISGEFGQPQLRFTNNRGELESDLDDTSVYIDGTVFATIFEQVDFGQQQKEYDYVNAEFMGFIPYSVTIATVDISTLSDFRPSFADGKLQLSASSGINGSDIVYDGLEKTKLRSSSF